MDEMIYFDMEKDLNNVYYYTDENNKKMMNNSAFGKSSRIFKLEDSWARYDGAGKWMEHRLRSKLTQGWQNRAFSPFHKETNIANFIEQHPDWIDTIIFEKLIKLNKENPFKVIEIDSMKDLSEELELQIAVSSAESWMRDKDNWPYETSRSIGVVLDHSTYWDGIATDYDQQFFDKSGRLNTISRHYPESRVTSFITKNTDDKSKETELDNLFSPINGFIFPKNSIGLGYFKGDSKISLVKTDYSSEYDCYINWSSMYFGLHIFKPEFIKVIKIKEENNK